MSAVDFTVNAQARTDVGKGASRRLRHTGKIPGVIYGAGKEATSLTLDHDEMLHHLEHEAFFSHILSINIDGSTQNAVLKDVQRDPAKPKILHMDFQRVSDTDKIHMHVPLHFVGEDKAPGVKAGGLVSHLMTSIDIICMAKDLPEYIEVNVGSLEMGEAVHLSEIQLPSGVEIPALAQGADHDLPVVNVHSAKGGGAAEEGEEAGQEGGAAEGE
ncbi:50S ribosomal protein L25/general stress protein Ctc [Kaarinaea lacus]